MKISAVVSTYNRAAYIIAALESLRNQTLNKEEYEIIIVNNNCTDNTDELCRRFIEENKNNVNIVYVTEKNQGLSFSRNRGIKEAGSELITYLDDDAIAAPDYLELIVDFMDKRKDVDAVGGKIIPKYSSGKEPAWLSKYLWGLVGHVDYGEKPGSFPVQKYPSGSNMTIRKKVLEELGMFNTELGRKGGISLASEEKDLFERLVKQGGKMYYLPSLMVNHCVDDYRLGKEHIKKLSRGVGASERLRTEMLGTKNIILKIAEYLFKFIAAFLLSFSFMIQMEKEKAWYIVMVRYYITVGFFRKNL
jgi:glycosyltransferase involved in cell wall biosynthesis